MSLQGFPNEALTFKWKVSSVDRFHINELGWIARIVRISALNARYTMWNALADRVRCGLLLVMELIMASVRIRSSMTKPSDLRADTPEFRMHFQRAPVCLRACSVRRFVGCAHHLHRVCSSRLATLPAESVMPNHKARHAGQPQTDKNNTFNQCHLQAHTFDAEILIVNIVLKELLNFCRTLSDLAIFAAV